MQHFLTLLWRETKILVVQLWFKKKKKKIHVCARKYRAVAWRNNNMNIWKLKHGSQNSKSEINLHIGGFRATCHEQRQSKLSFNSFLIIFVSNTELKIFITFDDIPSSEQIFKTLKVRKWNGRKSIDINSIGSIWNTGILVLIGILRNEE